MRRQPTSAWGERVGLNQSRPLLAAPRSIARMSASGDDFEHVPVLLDHVLNALEPTDGGFYADLTAGGAGHAAAVLDAAGPTGRMLAFDRDPDAIKAAGARLERFGDRATLVHAPFSKAPETIRSLGYGLRDDGQIGLDGVLLDIGVSSHQFDVGDRGFSIRFDGPLDMRMSQDGETAADLIGRLDVEGLTAVFRDYGEVRGAHRLAVALKNDFELGLIETTMDLVGLCERVLRKKDSKRRTGPHPATLPFQALRIAVNGELDELEAALTDLPALLAPGGVLAIITFHSLEDRMVKQAFRALTTVERLPKWVAAPVEQTTPEFELVGKARKATDEENQANPRARSARLRAIRRTVSGADRSMS